MPGELDVNVGGVWHPAAPGGCAVKVAGVWRTIDSIYANIGGVWHLSYSQDATPPGPVSSAYLTDNDDSTYTIHWVNPSDSDFSYSILTLYNHNNWGPILSTTPGGSPGQAMSYTFTSYNSSQIPAWGYLQTVDQVGNIGAQVGIEFVPGHVNSFVVSDGSNPYASQNWSWSPPNLANVTNCVSTYRVDVYTQAGSLVSSTTTTGTTYSVFVNPDTNYDFIVTPISLNGRSGLSSHIHRSIGHAGSGHYQANYGWGSEGTWTPGYFNATSGTGTGSSAVDGNLGTYWLSAGRPAPAGSVYWEGIQLTGFTSLCASLGTNNVLLSGCTVIGDSQQVMYLSVQDNNAAWIGPISAASANIASSGYPNGGYATILNHNYILGNGDTSTNIKSFDISGYGITYGAVDGPHPGVNSVTIAVTYMPLVSGSYKARVNEISLGYRTWQVLSYTWIQDVYQVNNGSW